MLLVTKSSLSWTERLQRVIDFKRAKRGLIGMHCSTYPADPAKAASAEETAKCIFMMEKECASGNMKTCNEPCV